MTVVMLIISTNISIKKEGRSTYHDVSVALLPEGNIKVFYGVEGDGRI